MEAADLDLDDLADFFCDGAADFVAAELAVEECAAAPGSEADGECEVPGALLEGLPAALADEAADLASVE